MIELIIHDRICFKCDRLRDDQIIAVFRQLWISISNELWINRNEKHDEKKNFETKNDRHSYRYEKNLIVCAKKFRSVTAESKKICKQKQKNDRELSIKKQNVIVDQKYQDEKIVKKTERQIIKFFQNVEIEKKITWKLIYQITWKLIYQISWKFTIIFTFFLF